MNSRQRRKKLRKKTREDSAHLIGFLTRLGLAVPGQAVSSKESVCLVSTNPNRFKKHFGETQ